MSRSMKPGLFMPLAILALSIGLIRSASAQGAHECTFCHITHNAPGPMLSLEADVEVLCLTCHGPLGSSQFKADVHTNGAGDFLMSCLDCHTPHGSLDNWLGGTNLRQVGRKKDASRNAKIETPNSGIRDVVFESRGPDHSQPTLHSFADDDQDNNGIFDGVCEVCHTQTIHHTNFQPDPIHYPGASCTSCHPHEDHFMPTAGSCQACHVLPRDNGDGVPAGGRREVVSEFSLSSHHVQGALEDSDCVICHEQSQHQNGRVRIKNVDDPYNMSLVVELTGDPMTDPIEAAKLEPVCLACHDDDGAAGAAPFSDGQMPPPIDSAAWAVASHQALTCFGNGAFGCHESGHGSEKLHLIGSYETPPTAPDFAEEEEGLCFGCHDGSLAGTDILTQFNKGSNGGNIYHHPVRDSEQSGGREAECSLCHNPHEARSSNLLEGMAGIDLNGNPIGHGTGNDRALLEYELCFNCHGDTFNAGRSKTSNKRVDFDPTNSSFHPVAASGRNTSSNVNSSLLGGLTSGSLIGCADCHNNEATADVKGVAANSSMGPQGPHGSTESPILRDNYWTNPTGPGNYNRSHYDLCFLCHDPVSLIERSSYYNGARTNFMDGDENLHEKHMVDADGDDIACVNCHYDTHSNQAQGGTTNWYINGTLYTSPPAGFKTRMVSFSPDMNGAGGFSRPTWWMNTSSRERRCYLDCHGEEHRPEQYRPSNGMGDDDPLTNP